MTPAPQFEPASKARREVWRVWTSADAQIRVQRATLLRRGIARGEVWRDAPGGRPAAGPHLRPAPRPAPTPPARPTRRPRRPPAAGPPACPSQTAGFGAPAQTRLRIE